MRANGRALPGAVATSVSAFYSAVALRRCCASECGHISPPDRRRRHDADGSRADTRHSGTSVLSGNRWQW
jgi:hypothetical protein